MRSSPVCSVVHEYVAMYTFCRMLMSYLHVCIIVGNSCHPDLLIIRGILLTPGLRLQLNSFILLCIVLKTDRDIVSGSFCCYKLYYSLSYQLAV